MPILLRTLQHDVLDPQRVLLRQCMDYEKVAGKCKPCQLRAIRRIVPPSDRDLPKTTTKKVPSLKAVYETGFYLMTPQTQGMRDELREFWRGRGVEAVLWHPLKENQPQQRADRGAKTEAVLGPPCSVQESAPGQGPVGEDAITAEARSRTQDSEEPTPSPRPRNEAYPLSLQPTATTQPTSAFRARAATRSTPARKRRDLRTASQSSKSLRRLRGHHTATTCEERGPPPPLPPLLTGDSEASTATSASGPSSRTIADRRKQPNHHSASHRPSHDPDPGPRRTWNRHTPASPL